MLHTTHIHFIKKNKIKYGHNHINTDLDIIIILRVQ
jgi:hypothetical protein